MGNKGQVGRSMQLSKTKRSKKDCYSCRFLKGDDYCKEYKHVIKNTSKGNCDSFKKSKRKVKKVRCKNCSHFKFEYYCDKRNKVAAYKNKAKKCKSFGPK